MSDQVNSMQLQDGIEYIKIHGLQRTCTNYLVELINNNFVDTKCLVNAAGWKHGHYCAPWTLGREVHVVTATKNPYAWLVSLYNYWKVSLTGPDLTDISFDQFVKRPVAFEEASGTPYLLRGCNPVQYWNDMNFHWMSIRMNTKKNLIVPYEALLENADKIMQILSEQWGIQRKQFYNCQNVCEPGQEKAKVADREWTDKEYYMKKKYFGMFSAESIKFVNDELDDSIVKHLGYELFK